MPGSAGGRAEKDPLTAGTSRHGLPNHWYCNGTYDLRFNLGRSCSWVPQLNACMVYGSGP
jgi:hypothetical protein